MPAFAAARLAMICLAASVVEAATVPRPAADLTIKTPTGQTIRLSQYKGRPLVLVFILTYCSHCQKTIDLLSRVQPEFAPRGLQVVASAIDAPAAVPGFIAQFRPPFPVGFNSSEEAMAFMQHVPMMVPYMPMIVFIDKDGTIRAQYEGNDPFLSEGVQERNLRNKIEELIKLGTPAKKSAGKPAAVKKSN